MAQDASADLVVSILSAVKEADIKGIIDGFNDDQLDLLMKYIYRGMANAENRCVFAFTLEGGCIC